MARMATYIGPHESVSPDEAARFERAGWAAEEKHDGCWAEVRTDDEGVIVSLTSRVGKKYSGDHVNGLLGLRTHLPGSVLAAELEACSEASTERYTALGYRCLHIFDAPVLGGLDLTQESYERRRTLLEEFVPSSDHVVRERIRLVRQEQSGFKAMFESVVAGGGEGLVLKKLDSKYQSHRSSGKVDHWVRCKAASYVDYVVVRIGSSPQGSPNLKVGLYDDGSLREVCTIKNPPAHLDLSELVGKVIEAKGAEVFASGALRHAHFERIREDKSPFDCVLA